MAHVCEYLVIHCIDFRFIKALQEFMEGEGLTGACCDIVSMAGAGKNIVSPGEEKERDVFLTQVDISKKLHHISKIYLVQHMDCGAYGGHAAFASLEEEASFQKDQLAQAKEALEKRYLDISVIRILAHITHDGVVSFERVV